MGTGHVVTEQVGTGHVVTGQVGTGQMGTGKVGTGQRNFETAKVSLFFQAKMNKNATTLILQTITSYLQACLIIC